MTTPTLTLNTLSGAYELRRPRSVGEGSSISVELFEADITQAVRHAVSIQGIQTWDLLHELGEFGPSLIFAPEQVVSIFMNALMWGRLVVARDGGGRTDDADPSWSAYDAFIALTGREFSVGMRTHRLVSRGRAVDLRRQSEYDVVPAAEAQSIIAHAVKNRRGGLATTQLETLLKSIVDMRAPAGQHGFVLLRAPLSQASRAVSPEEVITPAKLKEIVDKKEKGWIEVDLADIDNEPVVCAVEVEDAEGAVFSGTLDKGGHIRFERVSRKGPALIKFPKLPDREGKPQKGTQAGAEASNRQTDNSMLAIVPGGPHVLGAVDSKNPCCLVRPLMTIVFLTPTLLDDVEPSQYVLRSADGRYEETRTLKDDTVPGDNLIQLEFNDLLIDGLYTLERTGGDDVPLEYFKDYTFMQIVDQPRGPAFDRRVESENEPEIASLEADFAWLEDDAAPEVET